MNEYNDIDKELKSLYSAKKSQILQRFFKTGKGEYGEGDVFFGITVPKQREVVKRHKDADFVTIKKLLNSKIHEYRMVGVLILIEQFKKVQTCHSEFISESLHGKKKIIKHDSRVVSRGVFNGGEILDNASALSKKKIFEFYLKNLKSINNWDLVDLSAPIIGDFLIGKDTYVLDKMAKSKNLWERRVAIMFTFAFIRKNIFQETFRISDALLRDKHDLIHKAVGWMLREVGKRDLQAEKNFLQDRYKKMSRTMLRYAIEKFEEKERKKYLNGLV